MYISPQLNKSTNVRIFKMNNSHPLFIRDLSPADQAGLNEGFHRLSHNSSYNRFLGVKKSLTKNELAYLCSPDQINHFALLAYTQNQGIGVARCVRDKQQPCRAEVALTIIDPFQKLGAGTLLFRCIAHSARKNGITHFSGYAFSQNHAILAFMNRYQASAFPIGEGVLEIDIPLNTVPEIH